MDQDKTNNLKSRILVLTTGGTIDKSYDEFDGSLQNRGSEIKKQLIARLRLPYTELEVISIMDKDSLKMNDYDRSLLSQSIKAQMEKGVPIVVIHGTDTMAKTATYVYQNLPVAKVPVVFTGAMKPLGFIDSDAQQNLTEALLASKLLDPGFYISFHNRVFVVPDVRKNPLLRTFECTATKP